MTYLFRPRGACLRAATSAVLAAIAYCTAGCQHEQNAAPVAATPAAAPSDPPATETLTVSLHDCPVVVRVQGSLMGDEQAVIGAKQAGRIKEVTFDVGSVVRRGQTLALLDTEEFDLHVHQVEAQLMQARAALGLKPDDPEEQLDREKAPPVREVQALVQEATTSLARAMELDRKNQNLITKEEVQQREAALAVAVARKAAALNGVDEKIALLAVRRAELALARQAQTDAVVVAPFDGVVQERQVAPGVYVNVGHPVVTLVRTNPLRLRAGVPEREALAVQVGQTMSIEIEGVSQRLAAQISRISPMLDMGSRSLAIEADIPNADGRLRAGLFAEAEIVIDARAQALAVPARAISQFAGVEKVSLLKDNKPKEVQVTTGRRVGDLVEIVSGLKVGDQIVVEVREGILSAE